MGHPFKHFKTITKHRHLVIKFCFKVGIGFQGLRHDLSKYSHIEFSSGAKYYTGDKSPIEIERKLYGYSKGWLHHKGRNRHHFEYWIAYDKANGKYVGIKMPIKYVKEMLCDRVAATIIYNKKNYTDDMPLEYLLRTKEGLGMHKDTYELIYKWLVLVKEVGHIEAFKQIKKVKDY